MKTVSYNYQGGIEEKKAKKGSRTCKKRFFIHENKENFSTLTTLVWGKLYWQDIRHNIFPQQKKAVGRRHSDTPVANNPMPSDQRAWKTWKLRYKYLM